MGCPLLGRAAAVFSHHYPAIPATYNTANTASYNTAIWTRAAPSYVNSPRVEDHTLEGTVLYILVIISHVDPPLPGLVWLEGRVERSVVFAHLGTAMKGGGGKGGG